jgi:hypothetical protein
MNNKYIKTTKHNLKDELLIKLRNEYIYLLSKDFLDNKIIPYEYIDKNLYLDYFNKNKEKISSKDEFIITDEMRFNFINQLLIKEAKKGTAKLIVNL